MGKSSRLMEQQLNMLAYKYKEAVEEKIRNLGDGQGGQGPSRKGFGMSHNSELCDKRWDQGRLLAAFRGIYQLDFVSHNVESEGGRCVLVGGRRWAARKFRFDFRKGLRGYR